MIDIDELERLINAHKMPGSPVSGATALALIAELRKAREAAARYDDLVGSLEGCSDGGCAIFPPKGMHTNGGCRCVRNSMKMQRMTHAAKQLRDAIGGGK